LRPLALAAASHSSMLAVAIDWDKDVESDKLWMTGIGFLLSADFEVSILNARWVLSEAGEPVTVKSA